MAFVPQSSFTSLRAVRNPSTTPRRPSHARVVPSASSVRSADAMEFFRHREGTWSSWRVTHHLAFRRAEDGESEIKMTVLENDDDRIADLCRDWDVDPALASGGCHVTWRATMAWDQEGENHEGSTVFALVPDKDNVRKGRILRDRGYAEIVPIAGTYYLDDADELNLETPYDGGAVEERFSFDGLDRVNRVSTVRRFGGFSTATFATEQRIGSDPRPDLDLDEDKESLEALVHDLILFGPGFPTGPDGAFKAPANKARQGALEGKGRFGGRQRTSSSTEARPSANSAFETGFSAGAGNGTATRSANGDANDASQASNESNGISEETMKAAEIAGIDLSKIPPSMREDFVASFNKGKKSGLAGGQS